MKKKCNGFCSEKDLLPALCNLSVFLLSYRQVSLSLVHSQINNSLTFVTVADASLVPIIHSNVIRKVLLAKINTAFLIEQRFCCEYVITRFTEHNTKGELRHTLTSTRQRRVFNAAPLLSICRTKLLIPSGSKVLNLLSGF